MSSSVWPKIVALRAIFQNYVKFEVCCWLEFLSGGFYSVRDVINQRDTNKPRYYCLQFFAYNFKQQIAATKNIKL